MAKLKLLIVFFIGVLAGFFINGARNSQTERETPEEQLQVLHLLDGEPEIYIYSDRQCSVYEWLGDCSTIFMLVKQCERLGGEELSSCNKSAELLRVNNLKIGILKEPWDGARTEYMMRVIEFSENEK